LKYLAKQEEGARLGGWQRKNRGRLRRGRKKEGEGEHNLKSGRRGNRSQKETETVGGHKKKMERVKRGVKKEPGFFSPSGGATATARGFGRKKNSKGRKKKRKEKWVLWRGQNKSIQVRSFWRKLKDSSKRGGSGGTPGRGKEGKSGTKGINHSGWGDSQFVRFVKKGRENPDQKQMVTPPQHKIARDVEGAKNGKKAVLVPGKGEGITFMRKGS